MCPIPDDEKILEDVRSSGAVNANVRQVEQISAASDLPFQQQVDRIRGIIRSLQALEEIDFRMCVARAQGQIREGVYDAWKNKLSPAVGDAIRKQPAGPPPELDGVGMPAEW